MSLISIDRNTLTGIADAIREKTETTDMIATTDMRDMILSIEGGGEKYKKGLYDLYPIPDKQNTGCKGSLTLWSNHPAFAGTTLGSGTLTITAAHLSAVNGVFENIDFDKCNLYFNKSASQYKFSEVVFNNCRFNSKLADGSQKTYCLQNIKSDVKIICNHCTFLGAKSSANNENPFVFDYCYASDMGADCWKITNDIIITNCFADVAGLISSAHADGIQFSMGTKFYIENFRCDAIAIKGKNVYNAGVYVDYESGTATELSEGIAKNIYVNGGGHSFYTISKDGYTLKNINIENYQYGCSAHYSGYNNGGVAAYDWFNEDTTKASDTLYVTSVWRENGKIKFLVTNYTNEDKTLIIRTSEDTVQSFSIPKCPTYAEYYNTYTDRSQFPFDLEYEVDDAEWFVAFDTEESKQNQIRYVELGAVPKKQFTGMITVPIMDTELVIEQIDAQMLAMLQTMSTMMLDESEEDYE